MARHEAKSDPLKGKLMLPVVEMHLEDLRKRAEKKRKPGQKNPVDLTGRPGVLRTMAETWDNQRPQKFFGSLSEVWLEDYFTDELEHLGSNTRRSYRAYVRKFIEWGQRRNVFAPRIHEFDAGDCDKKNMKPPLWKPAQFYKDLYESQDWYFRGVFAFLTYSLCRGSEAITLKVGDLDLASRRVNLIRHKTGDMDDRLPLLPELVREMQRYLMAYRECIGGELSSDMYLFPRFANNRALRPVVFPYTQRWKLSETCHTRIVAALPEHERNNPYITRGIGSHSVRRSMAAALFERLSEVYGNADAMRVVQGMCGHATVTMTELYIGKDSTRQSRDRAILNMTMFDDEATVLQFPGAAAV